jgi:hypothetical protein
VWPQGGEESIGGYTLDLETGPASADVQSLKHAAFSAFRSELPADIVRIVEPFASHQWALMVLLNERPRTIDLDILYYGDESVNEADLIIPHPAIPAREFVLKGLRELAPHLIVDGPSGDEGAA